MQSLLLLLVKSGVDPISGCGFIDVGCVRSRSSKLLLSCDDVDPRNGFGSGKKQFSFFHCFARQTKKRFLLPANTARYFSSQFSNASAAELNLRGEENHENEVNERSFAKDPREIWTTMH